MDGDLGDVAALRQGRQQELAQPLAVEVAAGLLVAVGDDVDLLLPLRLPGVSMYALNSPSVRIFVSFSWGSLPLASIFFLMFFASVFRSSLDVGVSPS
jgi:hypothetical protein